MSEVVHYVELDNDVYDDDDSMVMPYAMRVVLTEQSIHLLGRARMAYEATSNLYCDQIVYRLELGFPHVEYLKDGGDGPVPWDGEFSAPRMLVRDGCVEFEATVPNTDMTLHSCSLSWDRLDEEIRKWRSLAMGQSLKDAMPEQGVPAERKSGGMSPL